MDAPLNPLLHRLGRRRTACRRSTRSGPSTSSPRSSAAMREHRAEIDAIGAQPEPPTFDNTVAAFDRSGRCSSRVGIAVPQPDASATPRRRCRRWSARWRRRWPRTTARSTCTRRCSRASTRCTARRDALGLSAEQRRLLERCAPRLRARRRQAGAGRRSARYAQIMERLAELTTRFGAERARRRVGVPARAARARPSSPGCPTSCAPRRARPRASAASTAAM